MAIPKTIHTLMPALKYVPLTMLQPSAATGAETDFDMSPTTTPSTTPTMMVVQVPPASPAMSAIGTVCAVGALAGTGVGAYHGYKRNNDSIGWGIGWAVLGSIFWLPTLVVAYAQGLGKPKQW